MHDGKLLCVRLKPYKDHLKRDNSYWCLPGGGLDKGEALIIKDKYLLRTEKQQPEEGAGRAPLPASRRVL